MHDIRALRETPEAFVAGWSSRGVENAAELVAEILRLDTELRAAQTTGQEALSKRNATSKLIGAAAASVLGAGASGSPSFILGRRAA